MGPWFWSHEVQPDPEDGQSHDGDPGCEQMHEKEDHQSERQHSRGTLCQLSIAPHIESDPEWQDSNSQKKVVKAHPEKPGFEKSVRKRRKRQRLRRESPNRIRKTEEPKAERQAHNQLLGVSGSGHRRA